MIQSVNRYRVKVKLSLYRPRWALRPPGGWGSKDFWQSAHEGGKVVSPTHQPSLPPRKDIWYLFLLEAASTLGRPEKLSQRKISKDLVGVQTCDLPIGSAPLQPSALPPAPKQLSRTSVNNIKLSVFLLETHFIRIAVGNSFMFTIWMDFLLQIVYLLFCLFSHVFVYIPRLNLAQIFM